MTIVNNNRGLKNGITGWGGALGNSPPKTNISNTSISQDLELPNLLYVIVALSQSDRLCLGLLLCSKT